MQRVKRRVAPLVGLLMLAGAPTVWAQAAGAQQWSSAGQVARQTGTQKHKDQLHALFQPIGSPSRIEQTSPTMGFGGTATTDSHAVRQAGYAMPTQQAPALAPPPREAATDTGMGFRMPQNVAVPSRASDPPSVTAPPRQHVMPQAAQAAASAAVPSTTQPVTMQWDDGTVARVENSPHVTAPIRFASATTYAGPCQPVPTVPYAGPTTVVPPTVTPGVAPQYFVGNEPGYGPLITLGQDANNVMLGRGIIGQPVAYVPGQYVRNFLRYLSP